MALVRLAWSSFRRQWPLYALWVLSLSLAVTGLVIIDVYRQSLGEMVVRQGRKILTADISLSARRALSVQEEQIFTAALSPGSQFSRVTEMMAMVSAKAHTRLSFIRFIDDAYPLVGDLQVSGNSVHGSDLEKSTRVWVAADLLALLDVQVGDPIRIGNLDCQIAGVVDKDSSITMRFGAFAPRLYIHRQNLQATGLLQTGSTYTEMWLARLPTPVLPGTKAQLEKRLPDPALQVTVPADLQQGSLRVLTRLLDFLGLIGLITLSLGWVGVFYLGRRWLSLERTSSALLKCLGLSGGETRRLLLMKLLLILFGGVILGGVWSWFGARAVLPNFQNSLPPEFQLLWSWSNASLLILIGPLAGALLLYEPLTQLAFERPLRVLNAELTPARVRWVSVLVSISLVVGLFVLLTFLQARSWKVLGVFLFCLMACVGLITVSGFAALAGLRAWAPKLGWRWHLARAQWLRRPGTALLLAGVCALAVLLAELVPHLQSTLVGDLRSPQHAQRPALFLIDIQDEQIQPLQEFLHQHKAATSTPSPFIRARILRVNSQDFERAPVSDWSTREEEMDARMRNRGVNLTYRADLSPSEKILSGKEWNDLKPNEISVEKGYAERLNLKLGDWLTFDVQGLEVEAQIASLREINWDSFEPNFFIQFRSGSLLDEAPKTWIMTVKSNAHLPPTEMQRLISDRFSNVSSINVQETLDNITELISKLSAALQVASHLALALGIFVFIMILIFQLISSQPEWNQLQVLGVRPFEIWQLQSLSFGGLALFGASAGSLLAMAVNWGLARWALSTTPVYDFQQMFLTLAITCLLAWLGLSWVSWQTQRRATPRFQ